MEQIGQGHKLGGDPMGIGDHHEYRGSNLQGFVVPELKEVPHRDDIHPVELSRKKDPHHQEAKTSGNDQIEKCRKSLHYKTTGVAHDLARSEPGSKEGDPYEGG